MNEKYRVLFSVEIPELDNYFDKSSIREELNNYLELIIPDSNIQEDLKDWKLLITICFQSTNGIGIAKKVGRYPSDEEFEVFISIPIPNKDEVDYGVSEVNEEFYKTLNEKYSYITEPNYANYTNLSQYILESSKQAINLAFTKGFTCNGIKIKFQKW